jgi:hypothetical protein
MSDQGQNRPAPGPGAKPPARPAAGGQPRRRPGDKPFVPFSRFEDIVVRCGHTEKFGLLPDNMDRFREGRRKKALSRDCKACRERKQAAETEAAQKRQIEKEKRRAQGESGRQPMSPGGQGGRLPDGSRFEVQYDADKQQWSGTLTVPTATDGGEAAKFTGSGSGLFPLLSSLDRQYRATLPPSPEAEAPAEGEKQ